MSHDKCLLDSTHRHRAARSPAGRYLHDVQLIRAAMSPTQCQRYAGEYRRRKKKLELVNFANADDRQNDHSDGLIVLPHLLVGAQHAVDRLEHVAHARL